jgi:hypothetical protein
MFEDGFSLTPINFFPIGVDCRHIKSPFPQINEKSAYLLPSTAELCDEKSFGKVYMGWNREGIELQVVVDQPVQECFYPDVSRGDGVELFFDTRDVKTSGYNTRFCHHFFFLPEAVDGHQAGELTRFRTEDVHELCDPNELKVKSKTSPRGYSLQIFIPSHCLYGYDPDQFARMGFTYRLNRYRDDPQHFSAVSEEYQIEQQPSLWSSVQLVKE